MRGSSSVEHNKLEVDDIVLIKNTHMKAINGQKCNGKFCRGSDGRDYKRGKQRGGKRSR